MNNLPNEIINIIFNIYWSNIYYNNVILELNKLFNIINNIDKFINKKIFVQHIILNNNDINIIKEYNNYIKTYYFNNKSLNNIIHNNYYLIDLNDLNNTLKNFNSNFIYFTSYCINKSGYMRYYLHYKLKSINDLHFT